MTTPQLEAAKDLFSLIDRNARDTTGTAIAQATVDAAYDAGLYGVMGSARACWSRPKKVIPSSAS